MNHPAQKRGKLRLLLGQRIAPPRFLAFLVLMPMATLAHSLFLPQAGWLSSLTVGFDAAALAFLVSLVPLLGGNDPHQIRCRAEANEANRIVVLAITSLLTVVILAAISGELPGARHGQLASSVQLVATLLLIWLFANSVYALHYAHDYYRVDSGHGGDAGGLDFPGGLAEPGYIDFAYFAFTLGMTFQTSDTAITSSRFRAVVILHSFAAFVFNIGVIAFTINVLGGAG